MSDIKNLIESYYEIYSEETEQLDEMGQPGGNRPGQQSTTRGAVTMYAQPRPNTGQSHQSRFRRQADIDRSWQNRASSNRTDTSKAVVGNLGSNYRGQELQAGAKARASQVGTSRQGSAGTGAAPSAASRPAVSRQAPAAAPTRPVGSSNLGVKVVPPSGAKVAPTVAKPTTPAPGTKAAGPESIKPKTPNPLLAGGELRRMQQASQMRQKGINVTSDQIAAAERTKPSTVK